MDKRLSTLLETEQLSLDQCLVIAMEHQLNGASIEHLLLESGFMDGVEPEQKAVQQDLDNAFSVDAFVPDLAAIACLEEAMARKLNVLPIAFDNTASCLHLGVSQRSDVLLRDRVRREVDAPIQLRYSMLSEADIAAGLDRCFGMSLSIDDILQELANQTQRQQQSGGGSSYELPIVRLVDALLNDAVRQSASDIHLSPENIFVRIRYRIDGVMVDSKCLHIHHWPALLVRIKVMCAMDIAETRNTQDGQLSRYINAERIDFRVSSFPTIDGENLVLRVLDKRRSLRKLQHLPIAGDQQQALNLLAQKTDGLLLVCGPTGSGKTTTLYALLQEHDSTTKNIMTIEDPVEYPMLGIRQAKVQASGKFGFAEGVRGMLRQDPDVILIGEIRDKDSCAMAMRAAMTGHQVLSSLHASDSLGAIKRLQELGASVAQISSVVSGVVSQRLLRCRCKHCSLSPLDLSEQPLQLSTTTRQRKASASSKCSHCHGSGYRGRIAIVECLSFTDAFCSLLSNNAATHELRKQAIEDGMQPLFDVAKQCIDSGITTAEEVHRVFGYAPSR